MVCPRPPQTLTFDRLTLKLVCKSRLRWDLPSKFGRTRPLRSGIIRCVHDGQTHEDGQTDGQTIAMHIASFPMVGGIITEFINYS